MSRAVAKSSETVRFRGCQGHKISMEISYSSSSFIFLFGGISSL